MKIYERETTKIFLDNLYKADHYKVSETFIDYLDEPVINSYNILPIAFYLPQYYPVEVNDKNWGTGFTEWTNVTRALPQFINHYQPHRPEKFGYYDTRIPDILLEQATLAHSYGITAFCFYYYYFQGKTELEYPIKAYANSANSSLPFCLCWANENWTRRWDGQEHEMLLEQKYDSHFLDDFVQKISAYFEISHYLKIDQRPVVLIYNPGAIPNIKYLIAHWREYCYKKNISNPFIIASKTFKTDYKILESGFDALMEFPPHGINTPSININDKLVNFDFKGRIYNIKDYIKLVENNPPDRIFRGLFPSWDNTSRIKERAKIFIETTPETFELWCDIAIKYTTSEFNKSSRLLFINAWNEWGEGAHLEPDKKYGYAYLQALRNSLNKKF